MKKLSSSKTVAIWLLAIAIAVLLYFLLSNSKEPDTHATDHAIVHADNKIIIAQRDAGIRKSDSLENAIRKRDTTISKQKTELAIYRRDLDKSTAKAVKLAKEIKLYHDAGVSIEEHYTFDTSDARMWEVNTDWRIKSRKCDSLASEALNFAWLYEQYKAHSDSLSVVVDKNSEDYVKALEVRRKIYDELYSKYEQLYRLYNILFKDHQQAGKKLRREKLKTKVAALLGLVGAGVIILK